MHSPDSAQSAQLLPPVMDTMFITCDEEKLQRSCALCRIIFTHAFQHCILVGLNETKNIFLSNLTWLHPDNGLRAVIYSPDSGVREYNKTGEGDRW